MTLPLDALVLSPHPDDAVLSLGGTLFRRRRLGLRVKVVTVFAGDPPPGPVPALAADLRRWWGLGADAEQVRRAEDRAALATLDVEPEHLAFAEAPARRDPQGRPLYPTLRSLFGRLHPLDRAAVPALAAALARLEPAREVLAPLAIGRQVDHRLLRAAAEAAFGRDLIYFEDFPYERRRFARWRALGLGRGWTSQTVALDEEAILARVGAVACYRSQLRTLFGGPEAAETAVRDAVRRRGGERLWRRVRS